MGEKNTKQKIKAKKESQNLPKRKAATQLEKQKEYAHTFFITKQTSNTAHTNLEKAKQLQPQLLHSLLHSSIKQQILLPSLSETTGVFIFSDPKISCSVRH